MSTPRNWLRFRLSSMLLVTTLVGLWSGWQAQVSRQQFDALNQLLAMGGYVLEENGQPSFFLAVSLGADRAADSDRVTAIGFLGSAVSDAEIDEIIRHASVLPGLQRLTFMGTGVTYAGEHQLQTSLPKIQIQVFIPICAIE